MIDVMNQLPSDFYKGPWINPSHSFTEWFGFDRGRNVHKFQFL